MVKSRHRRPSNTRKNVQRAVTVTGATALALGATTIPAMANGPEAWDVIARCESGNKNIENAGPSTASGYFQIVDGTWIGAGGEVYAPRAIGATYDQQLTVAQEIAMQRGSLADWNASIACWGDEITSAVPAFVAPAPAPIAEPAPVETAPEPVTEEVVTAGATYTVVAGDTLIKIGAQVGKTWEELAALNGLSDPWTIYPDQVLKIEDDKVEYVVVPGDTLSEIAPTLDVTTQELYDQNKDVIGPDMDLIFPGQVFFVGGLHLPSAPVTVEEESRPVEEEAPVASASGVIVPGATFTSEYGPRWGTMHNGIDLAAPIGTSIYAAQAGTVITAEAKDNGFGQWVRVQAADGTITVYGHIDSWLVNVGDSVAAGQQIATVGNRGDSTGPHLHFEVHIGPGPINPVGWLAEHGISY